MSVEKSSVTHRVQSGKLGDLLIVQTPTNSASFRLTGARLEVDLNRTPLGSGTITRLGEKVIYGRVYKGQDQEGEFGQVLSGPEEIDGRIVRHVGPKVRRPYDSPRFDPYTETLKKTREVWGQRPDS